jgi:hypothetical protein
VGGIMCLCFQFLCCLRCLIHFGFEHLVVDFCRVCLEDFLGEIMLFSCFESYCFLVGCHCIFLKV